MTYFVRCRRSRLRIRALLWHLHHEHLLLRAVLRREEEPAGRLQQHHPAGAAVRRHVGRGRRLLV